MIVITVIIAILVEASIKKLKKELGIMKALGYTSKELRFQVAFRTIPAVIIASLIGTGVAIFWFKVVYGMIMGAIPINLPGMLLIDLIIVMFSVVAGYFGTRKIKTISVTELVSAEE